MVDVGSQQSPQVIYFGTDLRLKDSSKWVVPIELLAGYFFVLVALIFVGLGPGDGAAVRSHRKPPASLLGRHPRQPGGHRGLRP